MAQYLTDNKDYKGAIEDYKKSLEFYPEYYTNYSEIASCYVKLNDIEKALFYLDIAIEKDPKNYTLYSDKVNCLRILKKYDEALKIQLQYDEIYKNEFGEIESYEKTANSFFKAENYSQALKYINKAIKHNEGNDLYLAKCCILLEAKKYKKLIKYCDKIAKSTPDKDKLYGLYIYIGLANYYADNYKEALEYFNKTIKAKRDYTDAYLMKYYTEHLLGKTKQSIKNLQKLIKKYPMNTLSYGYLLAIYYEKELYIDSIKLCNQYLKAQKGNKCIYGHLAFAYKQLWDFENFKLNYDKVFEINKNITKQLLLEDFEYIYRIKIK